MLFSSIYIFVSHNVGYKVYITCFLVKSSTICTCLLYTSCVYYGSEWGAKADKSQGDPALRPSFKEPEFNELSEFISKLADIKKNSKALNYGDFTSTVLTNKQWVFRRSTGDETVYVAINADDQEYTAYFGAEKNQVTDLLSGAIINLDGGLKMAPYSAYFLA